MFATNLPRALLLAGVLALAAGGPGHAAADASGLDDAFARLKTLVGRWEVVGSTEEGQTVRYYLTGRGSAVVEQFEKGGRMTSVYHRDDDAIRATHYCSAGNQPRMRADAGDWNPETGELKFDFVDVTNVAEPEEYYTRTLRLVLGNSDRLEIHFWGVGHGKEFPVDLELRRISD